MFYITVPYFNLDHIYGSQQCYNWIKVKEKDYVVKHRDKIVRVRQNRDNISLTCSEEDFYNIWYDYFDMGTDYAKLHFKYRNVDKDIKRYCNKAKGMHIIKQDLLMVIVSCILESTYEHSLSDYLMSQISKICGKKRKNTLGGMSVTWYEFPSVEQMISNYDKIIKSIGNDILYENFIKLLSDIKDGWFDINVLKYSDDNESRLEYLLEFDYINKKVAKRILLLGVGCFDIFPTDKRVSRLVKRDYKKSMYGWFDYTICGEIELMNDIGYLNQVMVYSYNNYT